MTTRERRRPAKRRDQRVPQRLTMTPERLAKCEGEIIELMQMPDGRQEVRKIKTSLESLCQRGKISIDRLGLFKQTIDLFLKSMGALPGDRQTRLSQGVASYDGMPVIVSGSSAALPVRRDECIRAGHRLSTMVHLMHPATWDLVKMLICDDLGLNPGECKTLKEIGEALGYKSEKQQTACGTAIIAMALRDLERSVYLVGKYPLVEFFKNNRLRSLTAA